MTLQIVLAIVEIFGLFMIGGAARRLGYISNSEITRWARLVMDFLMPPFMFVSIVNGFDADRLHELWLLPATGFGMVVFFTLAGMVLRFGLRSDDPDTRRTFLHLCTVNNSTFLPTIILSNLWGDAALANLFLLYLGGVMGVWTFGVGMLGGSSIRQTLRNILTPTLFAIFCAVGVSVSGTRELLPELVMSILGRVGSIAVSLMLILTGAALAHRGILKLTWQNIYIAMVRIILLPMVTIPLLWLLPLPEDIYMVAVIVALMPSAISSVIMTRRFGGNSEYAATTALITTTCCMATAPFGVWLLFGR